jgi:2-iminobutanoate/2-iminopropanoate deaminase
LAQHSPSSFKKELVNVNIPDKVKRIGPFSQAIRAGPFVFLAGQAPLDQKTGEVVHGTIQEETRVTFENIKRNLEAAGTSLDNLVRLTIFLADFKDYEGMNVVRKEYVGKIPPVSSAIQVAYMYQGIKVEIEATAVVP